MRPRPLTPGSDPAREIPTGPGARVDCIHAALASLEEEERRLRRLGFESPLARCHEARRFWSFLGGLYGAVEHDRETAALPRWARSS
jgi:hypothetical protein